MIPEMRTKKKKKKTDEVLVFASGFHFTIKPRFI